MADPVQALQSPQRMKMTSVAVSPSGAYLAVAGDSLICIFDLQVVVLHRDSYTPILFRHVHVFAASAQQMKRRTTIFCLSFSCTNNHSEIEIGTKGALVDFMSCTIILALDLSRVLRRALGSWRRAAATPMTWQRCAGRRTRSKCSA